MGSEYGPNRQVAGRPDSRCGGSEPWEGGEEGPTGSVCLRLRCPFCSLAAGLGKEQGSCGRSPGPPCPAQGLPSSQVPAALPGALSRPRLPVPPPCVTQDPQSQGPPAPGHMGSQGGVAWGGGAPSQAARSPPAPSPAPCVPGLQRDLTAGRGGHLGGGGLGGRTLGGQPPGAELSPSTTVPPKGAAALGASDQPPGLCSPSPPPSP